MGATIAPQAAPHQRVEDFIRRVASDILPLRRKCISVLRCGESRDTARTTARREEVGVSSRFDER